MVYDPRERREMGTLTYLPLHTHQARANRTQDAQVSPLFSRVFLIFLHLQYRVARGSSIQSHLPVCPTLWIVITYHPRCYFSIHFYTFDHHLKCLPLSLVIFYFSSLFHVLLVFP